MCLSLGSLLYRVYEEGALADVCVCLPFQLDFLRGAFFLLSWLLFFFASHFVLLCVCAFKGVSVLEVPGALTVWFVVREGPLVEHTVRVDPLASNYLTVFPLTLHFHAGRLACVGASAFLLTESPPARVDVTIWINEDTLTMAAAILPVALVITDLLFWLLLVTVLLWWSHVVNHLSNAVLEVLLPLAVVDVTLFAIAIGATSITDTVSEVTLVNVAVRIVGNSLTCVAA